MSTLVKDSIAGAKWGAALGAILSVWAVFLGIVGGSPVLRSRGGDGIHVAAVIAIYLVGGLAVGGLVGACRPLLQSKVGAVIIGVVAAAPLFGAVMFARQNFETWTRVETISVVIGALAFGGPAGLMLRAFTATHRQN